MFQLIEARPGAAWSLQISERYQKRSIVLCLRLLNCPYFHLHSAGALNPISCFILTWDAVGNQNSPSGRKKRKTFLQMMSLLALLSQHLLLLLFFVVKEKSPKNSFDLLPVRGWQCSNLLTFNPKFGDVSWIVSQILQLRPFLDYNSLQPTVPQPRVGGTTSPAKTTVASFDRLTKQGLFSKLLRNFPVSRPASDRRIACGYLHRSQHIPQYNPATGPDFL